MNMRCYIQTPGHPIPPIPPGPERVRYSSDVERLPTMRDQVNDALGFIALILALMLIFTVWPTG